ncbi:TPA: hypothetical protein IYH94_002792 [Enterococcus faecium]|nr:hypothetical protein [Enterococcus faecium]
MSGVFIMKKFLVILIYMLFVWFILFYLSAKLNIDNQSYISLVVIILFIIGLIIGIKLRKSK